MKHPIFVALDVDTDQEALKIAKEVSPYVGGFKVGPRLCVRYGAPFIQELAQQGEVFVDNKYYDIPSTMEAALRVTFESGASFATIHAGAGPEALARISELEKDLNQARQFRILAVTVLTSFAEGNRPPHWNENLIGDQVKVLAHSCIRAGLTGLVTSSQEVSQLRDQFPEAYLVTPGIRMPDGGSDDQSRVATPSEALRAGASALVIGRPIVKAETPATAAKNILESIH